MIIGFYTKNDRFGEFSNFSPFGIEMDGLWWPSVEHYFQAQKFFDESYREKIRRVFTAKDAAALGRSRKVPLRRDWEEVKDSVMYQGVLKKFQTHEELKDLLLGTGDADIVETAPGDFYWGSGHDGTGLNRLGQILMRVRAVLREDEPSFE